MPQRNAKEELIAHVDTKTIKCARIQDTILLPIGYTKEQYEAFLTAIDFRYDAGYGGQELFGTIWYTDGTWSERGEYDGSEWGDYMKCPEIPNELK